MWSDRQVRGSPYKVTITDQCDASKVVCSGDGLIQGIVGKEIQSLIDTRRAGPGTSGSIACGGGEVVFVGVIMTIVFFLLNKDLSRGI